MRRRDSPVA